MSLYELCRAQIDDFAREADSLVAGSENEATTRLRLIDVLLKECLGWHPHNIYAEEHQGGQYLDYVLSNQHRVVVVEAKKVGSHFSLPAGMEAQNVVLLRTLIEHSADTRAALEQVLEYAQRGGIPYAVLCNGKQLIAFIANRQDGTPPLDGKALVFSSPASMVEGFPSLWDALSPNGVRSGELLRLLTRGGSLPPPPERLSARLPQYPGFRPRTELETDVSLLADLFLLDIMQESDVSDEFLRECYCTSGALSQYTAVSKEILRNRYAGILEGESPKAVVDRKGRAGGLTGQVVSAALSRRPVVLLGDVGVGKSIFLKHLVRVDAADLLKNTLVFYIDFLRESAVLSDPGSALTETIAAKLREQLGVDIDEGSFVRAVYNKEINQFSRSIHGDLKELDPAAYRLGEIRMLQEKMDPPTSHVRRSLEHLRGTRNLDFLVILDNVDHHDAAFQEQIYVLGQSLAETWPVAVFLSLRPDTFNRSRRSGSITAYLPKVFSVQPPRVDLVISKRLRFAREQLESSGRLESFPTGLTVTSENLMVYLDVLTEAFERNESLVELVDN